VLTRLDSSLSFFLLIYSRPSRPIHDSHEQQSFFDETFSEAETDQAFMLIEKLRVTVKL